VSRAEPPYRRIVETVRAQIAAGELRAGQRMPSTRQLARQWGVAIATATRAMATLRDDGLVEPKVGSGTVVRAGAAPEPARHATVGREQVVRTAIAIADTEGLDALSMRRLASALGVGPMSLYRHVASKDDLIALMTDEVFGERELPDPGPDGWRAKLGLISRLHWDLCRRHLWLPRVISFTRPMLVPNALAHTEWTLRALDGLGLSPATAMREAITLPSLVMSVGLSLAAEVEAGQDSGVTFDRWWAARESQTTELLQGFPLLARIPEDVVTDLDGLFEYALARHLDGFAVLVDR
jgi:DNA-binding transcriptional regulator YhcF (GntR family)